MSDFIYAEEGIADGESDKTCSQIITRIVTLPEYKRIIYVSGLNAADVDHDRRIFISYSISQAGLILKWIDEETGNY